MVCDRVSFYAGSSPQVRGKRQRIRRAESMGRLIPAGAGKTGSAIHPVRSLAAHPRRCGENWAFITDILAPVGSSPQVRGKHPVRRAGYQPGRLIPAGAGKTTLLASSSQTTPAHPRRCGENLPVLTWSLSVLGSSPQVRGKPVPAPS